jgi:hypothetical protein
MQQQIEIRSQEAEVRREMKKEILQTWKESR